MKPLTRRSVTTGLAAAMTALPALGLCKSATGTSTEDLIREFIQKLLTERDGLTGGEWVERKIIIRVLQATVDEPITPWEPWEVELLAEMERKKNRCGVEGAVMTNVIELPKPKPRFQFVTVPIDISSPLSDCDLVAWQMRKGEGQTGFDPRILFDYWSPPDGRGDGGQFVKRGSPRECAYLGPMRYWPEDVERGRIKILGKVRYGLLDLLFGN
jgi:hypothetical protein